VVADVDHPGGMVPLTNIVQFGGQLPPHPGTGLYPSQGLYQSPLAIAIPHTEPVGKFCGLVCFFQIPD